MSVPSNQSLSLRIGEAEYALEPGRELVLGSSPGCDLRLRHHSIQPLHARIRWHEGAPCVDAIRGTVTVNGTPAARTPLRDGDTVAFGGPIELRVQTDTGNAMIVPLPLAQRLRPATATPREQTFADLMADELRHAPWFALSALLHAAVILLLLWSMPAPDPASRSGALAVQLLEHDGRPLPPEPPPVPQPVVETLPPLELQELPPSPADAPPAPLDHGSPLPGGTLQLSSNPVLRRSGGSSGGNGNAGELPAGSGEFRATVSQLRDSGLEIMFVFDSTGSMGSTITATRRSLALSLATLRMLVPDARFGLITYRDKGADEDYLLRELTLGDDFWRACNFVDSVQAGGGGDRPEAVLEGVEAAMAQTWRRAAKRVIVVAGDAPPQPRTEQKLLRDVKKFAADGRSHVHTMLCGGTDLAPATDTETSFAAIAKAGNGIMVSFEQRDRLLQQVLSLAIGQQFARDIAEIHDVVEKRLQQTTPEALDLVRRGGLPLEAALRRHPIGEDLVQAMLRREGRAFAQLLEKALRSRSWPEPGRQAAAYVLRRRLGIEQALIEPEQPSTMAPEIAALVRQRIAELPE